MKRQQQSTQVRAIPTSSTLFDQHNDPARKRQKIADGRGRQTENVASYITTRVSPINTVATNQQRSGFGVAPPRVFPVTKQHTFSAAPTRIFPNINNTLIPAKCTPTVATTVSVTSSTAVSRHGRGFTPSPPSPTVKPAANAPRWQQAKHRMDFYCKSVFGSLLEMRSACTRMILLDYAHEMERRGVAAYLSVVMYRYNVINWACDFYGMHHMSTSTVSILVELFDKYFIKSLEQREGDAKLASLFQDQVKLVTMSIVFTKVAMEYNEDKNYKLTSEDVNRYLVRDSVTSPASSSHPARQRFVTRDEFMECERDVLNTVEFCLWDIRSPKGVFEMFLTLLPSLYGYENEQERSLFPYYCRYVYDICQLDYEICNTFTVNTFLACILYVSKLHWPSNYLQVLRSCNEHNKQQQRQQQQQQSTQQQQQTTTKMTPEFKMYKRDNVWLIALVEAFDTTIDMLQNESERLLRLMDTNSCHSHHESTYMAKRYLSVEVGCAHAVGFPTLEFFQQHRV